MSKISVPDMSCGHCKASIEQALLPLGAVLEFDMPARVVSVEGLDDQAALDALSEIGFPAVVLK